MEWEAQVKSALLIFSAVRTTITDQLGVICKHFSGYDGLSEAKYPGRMNFGMVLVYMGGDGNRDSLSAYRSVLTGFTEYAMATSAATLFQRRIVRTLNAC